tara:strand:- start:3538 stop:3771 length:234 start_codon:yes stop_codon:yes gene_type:complete
MDEGPWYETMEIPVEEARNIFEKEYKDKMENLEALQEIIKTVIPDGISLGSYRGYFIFQHNVFKKRIREMIHEATND